MKFSWADYDDDDYELKPELDTYMKERYEIFYNNANLNEQYNKKVEEYNKTIEPKDEWTSVKRKKKRNNPQKQKCITCFPRNHVKKYIICKWSLVKFQHDILNRPMILAIPNEHFYKLNEKDVDIIGKIFNEIEQFCKKYNIKDYSIVYNQTQKEENDKHSHLIIKIKMNSNRIKELRNQHFTDINNTRLLK